MKAILLFILLGLTSTKAYTQEAIFFQDLVSTKKKLLAYKLPISITCHFKDGNKKRLLLKKVVPDSFIFETYYNQKIDYSCRIEEIDKFIINKKGEEFIYGGFGVLALSTLTAGVSFFGIMVYSGDQYTRFFATIFLLPTAALTGTLSGILFNNFPKVIRPNETLIYAK